MINLYFKGTRDLQVGDVTCYIRPDKSMGKRTRWVLEMKEPLYLFKNDIVTVPDSEELQKSLTGGVLFGLQEKGLLEIVDDAFVAEFRANQGDSETPAAIDLTAKEYRPEGTQTVPVNMPRPAFVSNDNNIQAQLNQLNNTVANLSQLVTALAASAIEKPRRKYVKRQGTESNRPIEDTTAN